MVILTINSGSSSLKFQCFEMETETVLCSGLVERLGLEDSVFHYSRPSGDAFTETKAVPDHLTGIRQILAWISHPEHGVLRLDEIDAMAHRFTHGVDRISQAMVITPYIEDLLEKTTSLAPLHNPPCLWGYQAARQALPGIPHVAVFDTAFHFNMPIETFLYGLPLKYFENFKIRRYGFHGTSARYVTGEAAKILGVPREKVSLIIAHLGSGASVTAVKNGVSVDNTLGYGTNWGLIMGTRSGDVDSDVLLFLIEKLGMTVPELRDLLYKKSGLLGISGLSSDMRDLRDAAREGHGPAQLAIDCFVTRVRKYIGAFAAGLGGPADAVVFTAGIGENSPETREEICRGLEFMGARLDPERNQIRVNKETGSAVVSREDSPVKILAIPTNEELMMAREAFALLEKRGQGQGANGGQG